MQILMGVKSEYHLSHTGRIILLLVGSVIRTSTGSLVHDKNNYGLKCS